MNNRKIKKMIREEFQSVHTPSRKNELLQDIQYISQVRPEDEVHKRKIHIHKSLSLAVVMCMIVIGFLFWPSQEAYSVAFEVNPSIELEVNNERRVEEVICHNEDAVLVLEEMDLENTDLDVAVNAIIGSMFKYGYISEAKNSVLVSVQGQDKEIREELKEQVASDVKDILSGYSLNASVVSQDYSFSKERQELAKKYGISVGKVTLIKKLIGVSPDYEFSDLVDLSINDLNTLIHYKNIQFKTITIDGVESHSGYLRDEEVRTKVLEHAQVTLNDLKSYEDELDVKSNQLVYNVNFTDSYASYSYQVNAISGEIVSFDVKM